MRKFEGAAGVVIQAAHQAVVQREWNTHFGQDFLHRFKVLSAWLVEKLADPRKLVDDGLILRNLAIENTKRVRHCTSLAIGAHFSDHRFKRFAQGLVVGCAVVGTAHRVQVQSPISYADAIKQGRQHLYDLRIPRWRLASRRRRTNDFRSDLIELAVAAFLRTLAAK